MGVIETALALGIILSAAAAAIGEHKVQLASQHWCSLLCQTECHCAALIDSNSFNIQQLT